MNKLLSKLLIAPLLVITYSAIADPIPQEVTICVACHGATGLGNAQLGYPQIAGLNIDYIKEQIYAFKDNRRNNPLMSPMAAPLNAKQIQTVAEYFSKQKAINTNTPNIDPDVLKLGADLANNDNVSKLLYACTTCHGPTLNGVGSTSPRLAGQHSIYIASQLNAWQKSERKTGPAHVMEAVAKRLSPEEITAVSDYLSTLPIKDENTTTKGSTKGGTK